MGVGSHPKAPGWMGSGAVLPGALRVPSGTSAGEAPQAASPPSSLLKCPSATLGLPGEGSPRRVRPRRLTQSSAECGRPGDPPAPRTAAPPRSTHLADTGRAPGTPGRAWPGRARGGAHWGLGQEQGARTGPEVWGPRSRVCRRCAGGGGSARGRRSGPAAPPWRPAPGPQPIGPSDAGRGGAWTPAGEGRLAPRISRVYSWAPAGSCTAPGVQHEEQAS